MLKIQPFKIIIALVLWLLVIAGVSYYYGRQWLMTPHDVSLGNENVYLIPPGASLYSVSRDLYAKKVLRWPRLWVFYARFADLTTIKAGEYRLAVKESPLSLLARFQSGDVIQHQITLVEGLTFKDYLNTLQNHQRIKKTLVSHQDIEDFRQNYLEVKHLEGWFFADTYMFTTGDTDVSVLLRAHQKMKKVLELEWNKRADNLPYQNSYQVLIMASIIEKETGAAFERKKIAGVFIRRLRKNMRLQTDPTVIYGMGDSYTGNLRKKDLETYTEYNTYMRRGLPPSPIAMVGKEAIQAALRPDSGNTLYFVARGDGTHYFSETLEEHNEAVDKYQKNRSANYRSSPIEPTPADAPSPQDELTEASVNNTEVSGDKKNTNKKGE